MTLHPKFVTDKRGKPQSVLLPIEEYQELLERAQDVIDADLIDEVRGAPRRTWNEVKAKSRRQQRRR